MREGSGVSSSQSRGWKEIVPGDDDDVVVVAEFAVDELVAAAAFRERREVDEEDEDEDLGRGFASRFWWIMRDT